MDSIKEHTTAETKKNKRSPLSLFTGIFIILLVVSGLLYIRSFIKSNNSGIKTDSGADYQGTDLRARAPYVMFRPRALERNSWVSAQLSRLPRNFSIPEALSPKVRHDSSGKRLLLRRDLSDSEYRSLYSQSDNPDFLEAMRRLSLELQINTLGFRSPDLEPLKAANEYRIAVLGASNVFNGDLRYYPEEEIHTTIAGLLAKEIKDNSNQLGDKNITFINAGVPSAVSGQELAQLLYHLLQLDLDLLVVIDGFNDFYFPISAYNSRPGYPYDFSVEEYRYYNFTKNISLSEAIQNWLNSFFGRRDGSGFSAKPEDLSKSDGISLEEYGPEILKQYFRHIKAISNIANSFGIKTAVFLQPYNESHFEADPNVKAEIRRLFDESSKEFQKLAGQESTSSLYQDFSSLNFGGADLFTDHIHLNPEGNRIFAKHIYDALDSHKLLDADPLSRKS